MKFLNPVNSSCLSVREEAIRVFHLYSMSQQNNPVATYLSFSSSTSIKRFLRTHNLVGFFNRRLNSLNGHHNCNFLFKVLNLALFFAFQKWAEKFTSAFIGTAGQQNSGLLRCGSKGKRESEKRNLRQTLLWCCNKKIPADEATNEVDERFSQKSLGSEKFKTSPTNAFAFFVLQTKTRFKHLGSVSNWQVNDSVTLVRLG